MSVCVRCGQNIPESARFCPACGAAKIAAEFITHTVATTPGPSRISHASADSATGDSRFLPGMLLAGRYRIVALLGRGGMGEVYRADDLTLGQPVALKFLPEAVASNQDALRRFRNEVRIARQVSHPNVCRVYDVGEVDGRIYLSMEYVDGEDLSSLLRRIGRLPGDKGLQIARQLCAGLAAAHEKGVLHRDLKPSNVMLDGRGQALLTDFGLAGLAEEMSGAEVRNGTPAYMAPEQLAGKEVTMRSDIYSLGLLLYETFTGKRPFEASTLEELTRARTETSPTNPSTLVHDLDVTVERVILRCLESDPARRPSSALAVAAALPGGDPLAAALAAGETPSPEMVAAAGDVAGISTRAAVVVFALVMLGVAAEFLLGIHSFALDRIHPPLSPEVLTQKAREIVQRLGYEAKPADSAQAVNWNVSFLDYVESHDKPVPNWDDVWSHRPTALQLLYRQSPEPLVNSDITNDLLTPGIVTASEPPRIRSGMIAAWVDDHGRLIRFEAMPPQLEKTAGPGPPPNWNALFAAADLDPAQFQTTAPLWTPLPAFDARMAWTGVWPGTSRPLRIEAAAWRGEPVWFSLIGPWNKPDRMPSGSSSRWTQVFLITLGTLILCGAAFLAWRNSAKGRGDRRGALRLAWAMFIVQMMLWLFSAHFVAAASLFLVWIIALSTSMFYGGMVWILYLALEPYVRRQWPQTIVSWSRVLTGHIRDPLVGRDVLFGSGLAIIWALIYELHFYLTSRLGGSPALSSTEFMSGGRLAIWSVLVHIPYSIRGTLGFFFVLFVLRVIVRNQWVAGVLFVALFASTKIAGSDYPGVEIPIQLLIFSLAFIAVLRFGLLALATAEFVVDILLNMPNTLDTSAWYFPGTVLGLLVICALVVWAFREALAGRRVLKADLFS